MFKKFKKFFKPKYLTKLPEREKYLKLCYELNASIYLLADYFDIRTTELVNKMMTKKDSVSKEELILITDFMSLTVSEIIKGSKDWKRTLENKKIK